MGMQKQDRLIIWPVIQSSMFFQAFTLFQFIFCYASRGITVSRKSQIFGAEVDMRNSPLKIIWSQYCQVSVLKYSSLSCVIKGKWMLTTQRHLIFWSFNFHFRKGTLSISLMSCTTQMSICLPLHLPPEINVTIIWYMGLPVP